MVFLDMCISIVATILQNCEVFYNKSMKYRKIKMEQKKQSNWISGIEKDISNNNIKKIFWFVILLVSFLSIFSVEIISVYTGISSDILSIILFFVFIFSISGYFRNIVRHPNYLAYYLYQVGNQLIDFENGSHHLKKNQKYIKNCTKQIKSLSEQKDGYFVTNVTDFFDNLSQIMLHLNYVFDYIFGKREADETDVTFLDNQTNISSKLIELAELIHENYSNLTPQHIELPKEILNLLTKIPIKSFEFHTLFIENIKQKWGEQPYTLRIFVFLLGAFILIYYTLFYFMSNYGLEKESCITNAIAGSIAIVVALLLKIDLFVKHKKSRNP